LVKVKTLADRSSAGVHKCLWCEKDQLLASDHQFDQFGVELGGRLRRSLPVCQFGQNFKSGVMAGSLIFLAGISQSCEQFDRPGS
jgi:hypothetical protein